MTDANVCTISETITIVESSEVTSNYVDSDWNGYEIQCFGGDNGSIDLSVSGGVVSLPYDYYIDGSLQSSSSGSYVYDFLTAGTYLIEALDANGCSTSHTVTMNEPSSAVTNTSTVSDYNSYGVTCNGLSDGWINFQAIGGVHSPTFPHTYSWSGSTISNNQNLSGLGVGTYTVVASDNNGCTTTETFVVTEPSSLTLDYDTSNYNGYGITCNGLLDGWINLTIGGGIDNLPYVYSWTGDANSSAQNLSSLGAGTYSVTVTDANVCTISDSVTLVEPEIFVGGSLSSDEVVCFNTQPSSILTILPSSGGNDPYTYEWEVDYGNGFVPLPNFNNDSYAPDSMLLTTSYKITYSDDYQCGIKSDTVLITVLSKVNPGSILDHQILCYNDIAADLLVDDSATGGGGDFVYSWQFSYSGDTNSYSYVNPLNQSTLYSPGQQDSSIYFRLEVTSNHNNTNCISRYTDSVYIHVYDSLIAGSIFDNDTICFGEIPQLLSFDQFPSGAGGFSDYVYQWYSKDSLSWILEGVDSIFQPDSLFKTTSFRLDVESDYGCGTKSTNEITIFVYPKFFSGDVIGHDTVCLLVDPDPVNLINLNGGSGIYDFIWQVDSTGNNNYNNIQGSSNLNSISPINLNTGAVNSTLYKYRVRVNDAFCSIDTVTNFIEILVNPLPIEYDITGDLITCANQNKANYTLVNTPNNYRYQWSTFDGAIYGTDESRYCVIDWPNTSGIFNLDVIVSIAETGCNITTSTSVELTNDASPDLASVILKPNSNILISSDSSINLIYAWGVTNIATEVDFYLDTLVNDLRYIQLPQTIDTENWYYWVESYFNYPNGATCTTRSYYNPPPIPLDITEIYARDFLIYPNPTSGIINVDASIDNLSYSIIDMMGKNVEFKLNYESNQIQMNNLNPGIYFLIIKSDMTQFTKKFIVE